MKKLPIGVQTFKDIRQDNYCYADKTPLISKLVERGKFYFLSRPRRFGKSLLIDTIAEAFAGNRELFNGLYLEKKWDWDVKHPVIKIDLAQGIVHSPEQLEANVKDILHNVADEYNIKLRNLETSLLFSHLIREMYKKTGKQVVVLVDEYDKPILDNITNGELAAKLRDGLRNIYSVLKAQGAHLRFVMLTGVSKFSKVSIFSGLNNLQDITLSPKYGNICGYTQAELDTVFLEYLVDTDPEKIKKWYYGYNFLADPVYNPFDILLYLESKEFKPYWFETGTPSFLVKMLQENQISIPALDDLRAGEELLGSFDLDFIEAETLLYQTGYLTITQKEHLFDEEYVYHLGFPNYEVRKSLTSSILHGYAGVPQSLKNNQLNLLSALRKNDFERIKEIFHAFFASIPHDWYRKNQLAGYEGYYCSVVYCYFAALGLNVRPEDATNHGRVDMTVIFEERVYIIEFKVKELTGPGRALAQIKQKKYAEKYRGQKIWLIGVEFSREEKNICCFEWERVEHDN